MQKGERKQIFLISSISGVIASLCCLTPIVLVLFGLSSVTFAASLGNFLYGDYRWAFRGVGLVLSLLALYFYFRRRGICTIDDYKKHRNRIINMVALTIIAFVIIYIVFTYVILEIVGLQLGLWTAPFARLFS